MTTTTSTTNTNDPDSSQNQEDRETLDHTSPSTEEKDTTTTTDSVDETKDDDKLTSATELTTTSPQVTTTTTTRPALAIALTQSTSSKSLSASDDDQDKSPSKKMMDHSESSSRRAPSVVLVVPEDHRNKVSSNYGSTASNDNEPPPSPLVTDDKKLSAWTLFQYTYSTILLLFSIVVVVAMILQEQTSISQDIHSALALTVVWVAIAWLSLVEGGQGALVGLVPVDSSLYQPSHPIAYHCTSILDEGNNLDRYLIGRQFLVILLVFVTNQCGAPVDGSAEIWDWPVIVLEVFVRSSLAIILVTAMMGQLHSQVNASQCMLDYINTRAMLFTVRVSLALEASGTMHAAYLLQAAFAWFAGSNAEETTAQEGTDEEKGGGTVEELENYTDADKDDTEKVDEEEEGDENIIFPGIDEEEEEESTRDKIGFYARVVFSVVLLCFSLAVTLTALFQEKTNMWSGIPVAVSVVLFFGLMIILGILEGTQIAVFAVSRLPMEQLAKYPSTVMKCIQILLVHNQGHNIPRFMIGRQIMVTLLTFLIARITTVNVDTDDENSENIWGVPKGLQEFFNTGLLGAIIVTLIGSISWKLLGATFPVVFLSNPMVYILINVCLGLEASGICSGAWVLAAMHRRCAGFQPDEMHVGTPEDRAAAQKPDMELKPEEYEPQDFSSSTRSSYRRSRMSHSNNSSGRRSSRMSSSNNSSGRRSSRSSVRRRSSTRILVEPMNQCGSTRFLQAEETSRASSRYLMGTGSQGSHLRDSSGYLPPRLNNKLDNDDEPSSGFALNVERRGDGRPRFLRS